MAKKSHIGDALSTMRKVRGLTQSDLSRISGLSVAGISRIENEDRRPRDSSINLILTAMASRKLLTEVEIARLSHFSQRDEESFRSLNRDAKRNYRPPAADTPDASRARADAAKRLQLALDTLIATGPELETIELLESMARWASATRVTADTGEPPNAISEPERRKLRTLRVLYPEQPGPVEGSVSQRVRTYEVNDDADRDTPARPDASRRSSG